MKRLVVFAYNDNSGVVGEATLNLLKEYRNISDRLVIVCNAFLTPQGRKEFLSITKDVYCLNCKNIIQVVYADALINYCGMNTVVGYDEVTLMSDDFWGPFADLGEIYDKMASVSCDYWQMSNLISIHEFVVLKNAFIKRREYKEYLEKMLDVYKKTFQNIGKSKKFIADVEMEDIYSNAIGKNYIYVDERQEKLSSTDMMLYLIREKGYPFLEKKLMELSYFDILQSSDLYDIKDIVQEIEDAKKYDFDLIAKERELLKKNKRTYDLSRNIQDTLASKIYLNYGYGYTEQQTCEGYAFINENGDFKVRYTPILSSSIVGFRYDPLEKIPNLVMSITKCTCDGVDVKSVSHNGMDCGNNFQLFSSLDPFYEFEYHTSRIGEIIIEGNITFVNNRFMEYMNSCKVTGYISNIYWDWGTGYSEERKIEKGLFINDNNEFELKIACDLQNICEIRFDPVEGFKSRVQLYEVQINGKDVRIKSTNGTNKGKREWIFDTFDPNIVFSLNERDIHYIYISGKIFV